jgi:hypothetical protein
VKSADEEAKSGDPSDEDGPSADSDRNTPAARSNGLRRARTPDPDFDHALRLQMMTITGE